MEFVKREPALRSHGQTPRPFSAPTEGGLDNGVSEEARDSKGVHFRRFQLLIYRFRRLRFPRIHDVLTSFPGHPSLRRSPRLLPIICQWTYIAPELRLFQSDERSESKYGFWGVLARKARSILEDDSVSQQLNDHSKNQFQMLHTSADSQFNQPNLSKGNIRKSENLSSSLNQIGGTIKSALEEGLMIVESRAADIIQETKKIQIRRKSASSRDQIDFAATENLSENLSDQENPLKASRNLANAMAAKAKLHLRELKTVKAELAFAKERCDQLVEENKHLRESREKEDHTQDDDLIRLQLETLLAEKGRLAQENSLYARENRFLREIVEYHNLTMQDVVHLDDGIEDIADDGTIHISLPYSSHSASEVISPAISTPHTPPDSSNSPNSDVQPDSSSPAAAPAPREDANELRSSSSPKSELPHLILKLERAD
ncbi:hypothetical protein IEQ34_013643 [Dendrobium chrysotoxum]|uniref:Uncharacterized protein n=1 Tax=Dendrobium chrysotoxum TaxID=161865 RepID=A0AAV7GRX5_DENCH|nr:hypothetical protein IEQ34_013643 [Dendrobium chrysotoxum]